MNLKRLGAFALLGVLACDRNAATVWRYDAEPGPVSAPAVGDATIAWGAFGGLHLITAAGERSCVQRDLGAVDAAPVIAGSTVWVGTRDREIVALDPRCAVRWRTSVPGRVARGLTLQGGTLYAATHAGRVVALDAQTGALLWVHPSDDAPPYRAFVSGAPRVVHERLYVGRLEGGVLVLERQSGALVALVETGPVSAPLAVDQAAVWVHDESGALMEIEGARVRTRFELDVPGSVAPLVTERRLYVGSANRKVLGINRQNGRVLWTYRTRGPIEGEMVLFRGRIVAAGASGDGRLYVIDPATGEGEARFAARARFAADLRIADGRLLAASEDGELYAFSSLVP